MLYTDVLYPIFVKRMKLCDQREMQRVDFIVQMY